MSKRQVAAQCLKEISSGMKISQAARKFKVSRATIYAWKKNHREKTEYKDNVSIHPTVKMYPTAEEQIASLEIKLRAVEAEYNELLSISREELAAAKDSIETLVDVLKQLVIRRFIPRYGGKPDYMVESTPRT